MLSVLAFKRSLSAGILDGGGGEISLGGSRLSRFMKEVENVTGNLGGSEPVTPAEEVGAISSADQAESERHAKSDGDVDPSAMALPSTGGSQPWVMPGRLFCRSARNLPAPIRRWQPRRLGASVDRARSGHQQQVVRYPAASAANREATRRRARHAGVRGGSGVAGGLSGVPGCAPRCDPRADAASIEAFVSASRWRVKSFPAASRSSRAFNHLLV